jgi:hypothetical protein
MSRRLESVPSGDSSIHPGFCQSAQVAFDKGGLLVLEAGASYRTLWQRGGEKLLPEKACERTKQALRKKIEAIKRETIASPTLGI